MSTFDHLAPQLRLDVRGLLHHALADDDPLPHHRPFPDDELLLEHGIDTEPSGNDSISPESSSTGSGAFDLGVLDVLGR